MLIVFLTEKSTNVKQTRIICSDMKEISLGGTISMRKRSRTLYKVRATVKRKRISSYGSHWRPIYHSKEMKTSQRMQLFVQVPKHGLKQASIAILDSLRLMKKKRRRTAETVNLSSDTSILSMTSFP